jgi:purine catabolism regulator
LDPEPLLRDLARSPDLRPFKELVEPLLVHDREQGGDLMRTLRVLFDSGGNMSEAAERLFLHRNSVPYRLERVRELTGLDWKESGDRFALQLGLLAAEKEEEMG